MRDLPPEVTQKARPRAGDDTLDPHEQERMSIDRALEGYGGTRRKVDAALKISTVTRPDPFILNDRLSYRKSGRSSVSVSRPKLTNPTARDLPRVIQCGSR